MSLVECTSASQVIENYKAVRARVNAWKPWTPPVVVEITLEPELLIPWPIKLDPPTPKFTISWRPNEIDPPLPPLKFPRVATIQKAVAERYGVTMFELTGQRRHEKYVWPRHIAMYLCRVLTPHSYPEIGRRFGGRDHTVVIHAERKIARLRGENAKLDAELRELEEKLTVEKHEATPAPGTDCSACGL